MATLPTTEKILTLTLMQTLHKYSLQTLIGLNSSGFLIKKELNSFQRIPALNSYDPGSCNNTIHGQEVLVTDKSDEDVILICVRNKGVYQWKPLDGKFILVDLGYCLCSTLLLQVQVNLYWYCHK